MDEIEVWRAAAVLIKHYGDRAEAKARRALNVLLCEGDRDGAAIWSYIWQAVLKIDALPSNSAAGVAH